MDGNSEYANCSANALAKQRPGVIGMAEKLRKTGASVIGNVPWGTHLCLFYSGKEDLFEILVPYFKAGLENNEMCMWITSAPLGCNDAKEALGKEVKNLDAYMKKGQIEIMDYKKFYTRNRRFDADSALRGWMEKEKHALEMGFDGLRITGNTFWLDKKDWRGFTDYEAKVNSTIDKHNMLAVCAYSLEKCGASEVLNVVSNHQFSVIRQGSDWRVVESSDYKKTKEELRRAYGEMETKVKERTSELEDEKMFVSDVLAHIAEGLVVFDRKGRLIDANHAFCSMTGYSKKELQRKRFLHGLLLKEEAEKIKSNLNSIMGGKLSRFETMLRKKNGSKFPVIVTPSLLKDKKGETNTYITIVQDVTKRKNDETEKERLRKKLEEYAKRLEVKVKRLEKKRLKLTDKEKTVFYSLVKWPNCNDIQLSKKTGIKRSTITAIRNKLLKHNWVAPVNVPNFLGMGFELVCISHGKASDSEFTRKFKVMDGRFRIPEVVLMYSTHRDFISFSFFRNLTESHAFDSLNNSMFNNNNRSQNSVCMPLELCDSFKFMDHSKGIGELFELDKKKEPEHAPVKASLKLTGKEKRIFYALVKYPGMNLTVLSRLIKIAVPTITKTRNKLIREGFIKKAMIPNIKKLGQPLLFLHARFDLEKGRENIDECRRKISEKMNEFVSIGHGNQIVMLGVFNDFHSEKEFMLHEMLEEMHNMGYLSDYPDIIMFQPKNIILKKTDFSSITRKFLGLEEI